MKKVKDVLKDFERELKEFLKFFGKEETHDTCFYIMIEDTYYDVDMKKSYWYHEDDGSVVFRVNLL